MHSTGNLSSTKRCHSSLARCTLARVSLTRASLARFILTRSQFGAFQFGVMPVWRVSLRRVFHFCVYFDPVGLLWRTYHFLRICPSFMRRIVCVIYLLIVSTRHRATA